MVPKMKTHAESYQKRNQDINPKKMQLSNHNSIKNQMEKKYLGRRPLDQPRSKTKLEK